MAFMINSDQKIRFGILDPMRFLAAFAVVFYHYSIYLDDGLASSILKFGYLGVNFFFLLSGFVIMFSAQNRSAFGFAFARALRLYPSFILCLIITIVVAYFINGERFTKASVLLNMTIMNDYFGVANIDGVYWTLQAELKFYGCVFFLLLVGAFSYWRYWLSIWLLLSSSHYFIGQPYFLGWIINPEYSFYFIGGVCAYLMYKFPSDLMVKLIFLCAMIFSFFVAYEQSSDFMLNVSHSSRLVSSCIVLVFFAFFYFLSHGFFNVKKRSFLILLGVMSYPIYLIHNKAGKAIIELMRIEVGIISAIICATSAVIIISYLVVKFEEFIKVLLKRSKKYYF